MVVASQLLRVGACSGKYTLQPCWQAAKDFDLLRVHLLAHRSKVAGQIPVKSKLAQLTKSLLKQKAYLVIVAQSMLSRTF